MLAFLGLLGVLGVFAAAVRLAYLDEAQAFARGLGIGPGATAELLSMMIAFGLAAIGAGLLVSARMRGLADAAERIADGKLDAHVTVAPGGGAEARIAESLNRLAANLAATHDAATTDKLTGVANRAALMPHLYEEVERATRYGRPLSVAFVDIDHFKQVNDTYGHHAGDVVLRHVATILRANIRASDFIGRYGGEEFMLVFPETEAEEAAQVTEKLRALVQRERVRVGSQDLGVTISIGIAGATGQKVRFDTLVHNADAAMYSAKNLGRNQTYVFNEPDEESRVVRAPISPEGRATAMAVGRQARDAALAALRSMAAPLAPHAGRSSRLLTELSVEMARRMELPSQEVERIQIASSLLDLGKVALPDDVLDKPAPLSAAEWQTVVQHSRLGQLILEQASALRDAVPIVLHHHERYSGHGYPFGIRGNEIPIGARITAVADAYQAMVSERPYRPALDHRQALAELKRHAGTQFDPEVVKLFVELFNDGVPEVDEDERAHPPVRALDSGPSFEEVSRAYRAG